MALWHTGSELPKSLIKLLRLFSQVTGDPQILTYQDIIIENPRSDLRTFFHKKSIGQSESFFYVMHQIIEDVMIPVIGIIKNAISLGFISENYLNEVQNRLIKANQIMGELMDSLNNLDFVIFRKFLSSVGDLKGPSGAFSGTYPILDLLWLGNSNVFKGNLERYKVDNMYFPSFQRKDILSLTNNIFVSVNTLKSTNIAGFESLYEILQKYLTEFRGRHLGAVKKHIPDVFNDKERGTMGQNATGNYLKDSLKHTKEET